MKPGGGAGDTEAAARKTAAQSGIKSSLSITLNFTTRRRIPASTSTNQGLKKAI